MSQIKFRERPLPDYTRGEEYFNMISHIAGGALGIAVLVLSVVISAIHSNPWAVVGSSIYGATFVLLYTISSVYHGLRPNLGKRVMRVLDHCTIYIYIAGTYTPILLSRMRPEYPGWAWSLFGIVWGIAALAIAFTAIDMKRFSRLSMVCYIGMGWCVLAALKPLMATVPAPGLWLLVSGGIVYTIGAALYGIGKKRRYVHSLFHLFVLAGSVLQALCIMLYVI